MIDAGPLEYKILMEKGPAHNREFVSIVLLNGIEIGTGSGRSKKDAEQHAAQMALEKLKSHLTMNQCQTHVQSREEIECF